MRGVLLSGCYSFLKNVKFPVVVEVVGYQVGRHWVDVSVLSLEGLSGFDHTKNEKSTDSAWAFSIDHDIVLLTN